MTRSNRVARLLATTAAASALAAPAAVARPLDSRYDLPYPNEIETRAATRPVVVQPVDAGFDWDSAAIGAGGATALVLLVSLGGVGYVTRHRVHPTV
jgi:hypothetical protein